MSDESGRPGSGEEPLGNAAEEAVKLLGALSEWARDHGSDLGHGLSGLAGQAASFAADVDAHVATGAEECRWCPVCRAVHAVRQTSPEVRAHLASAAASLMQAAAGMLATQTPRPGRPVERIDLDDDGAWPDDEPPADPAGPEQEEDR